MRICRDSLNMNTTVCSWISWKICWCVCLLGLWSNIALLETSFVPLTPFRMICFFKKFLLLLFASLNLWRISTENTHWGVCDYLRFLLPLFRCDFGFVLFYYCQKSFLTWLLCYFSILRLFTCTSLVSIFNWRSFATGMG